MLEGDEPCSAQFLRSLSAIDKVKCGDYRNSALIVVFFLVITLYEVFLMYSELDESEGSQCVIECR